MKEKGQAMVEFAVILPFMIALSVAIIYLGALFLDYTQYSNAARDIARDISLQSAVTETDIASLRKNLANQIKNGNTSRYAVPLTNLYKPTWGVKFYKNDNSESTNAKDAVDVEVSVTLKKSANLGIGGLLADWGVLPDELKTITFKMALEKSMVVKTTN